MCQALLQALYMSNLLILTLTHEVNIFPILEKRKLRHREAKRARSYFDHVTFR